MSDVSPPRPAERFLEALGADAAFRDDVLGDLAEELQLRVSWDGPAAARRWYLRETVRVAPYLLRDWVRGLRWENVGYFTTVVAASLGATMAGEGLVLLAVRRIAPLVSGITLDALRASGALPWLLLFWTLVDVVFGGYIAARLGRRARLPSALLLGVVTAAFAVWSGAHVVPPLFLIANAATLMVGTAAGGLLGIWEWRATREAATAGR